MDPKKLSQQETSNAVFLKLISMYEDRLNILRKKNDSDLDDVQTAKLRGRILEVRRFLAMASPSPIATADDD